MVHQSHSFAVVTDPDGRGIPPGPHRTALIRRPTATVVSMVQAKAGRTTSLINRGTDSLKNRYGAANSPITGFWKPRARLQSIWTGRSRNGAVIAVEQD
jgi:hypothetical protein